MHDDLSSSTDFGAALTHPQLDCGIFHLGKRYHFVIFDGGNYEVHVFALLVKGKRRTRFQRTHARNRPVGSKLHLLRHRGDRSAERAAAWHWGLYSSGRAGRNQGRFPRHRSRPVPHRSRWREELLPRTQPPNGVGDQSTQVLIAGDPERCGPRHRKNRPRASGPLPGTRPRVRSVRDVRG